MGKARKFAVEGFAESLLPVKDSLEAAIAIPAATPEQLLEGVHATLRQLTSALERNKVVEVNPPAGAKFDPHQHQAISVVPAAQEPNTVVAVLQKGYLDRRPRAAAGARHGQRAGVSAALETASPDPHLAPNEFIFWRTTWQRSSASTWAPPTRASRSWKATPPR